MTTGGGDAVFVDTNVLIYAGVSNAPRHLDALAALRGLRVSSTDVWVSRQVLREYIAVLSRPQTYANAVPVEILVSDVRSFLTRFRVAEDDPVVTDRLLTLLQQFPIGGKQVHDANIVATMLAYGIRRLLTANVRDFARYAELIVVEPLAERV